MSCDKLNFSNDWYNFTDVLSKPRPFDEDKFTTAYKKAEVFINVFKALLSQIVDIKRSLLEKKLALK